MIKYVEDNCDGLVVGPVPNDRVIEVLEYLKRQNSSGSIVDNLEEIEPGMLISFEEFIKEMNEVENTNIV